MGALSSPSSQGPPRGRLMPGLETGTVSVLTRGHYRIRIPEGDGPHPLLIGFHGYAQNAEEHLEDLLKIPGTEDWAICAAQGLHLFYRRIDRVVGASWMTRFGRDEAIVDNLGYVSRLVATLRDRYDVDGPLVYCGFSQGVAMAYRAAAGSGYGLEGLLVLVGDVPPEITPDQLSELGPVLLGCGRSDKLYDERRMQADLERLGSAGARVETCIFDGGHEWHPTYLEQSGQFLARVLERWDPAPCRAESLAAPTTIEDVTPPGESTGS